MSTKTFVATCPCGFCLELAPGDLSIHEAGPLRYSCSCGLSCKVFDNRRRALRKKVGLAGRVVLSSDPWRADWFGTILDISIVGMLMQTDPISNIYGNESLRATILLEDKKTKMGVHGQIRRIVWKHGALLLGIEFRPLTAVQQHQLDFMPA